MAKKGALSAAVESVNISKAGKKRKGGPGVLNTVRPFLTGFPMISGKKKSAMMNPIQAITELSLNLKLENPHPTK